jgi:hypothetical protein
MRSHRVLQPVAVLIFLFLGCIPSFAQLPDESHLVVFIIRTHFDAGSGSSQTCLRVTDDARFRLEKLPDAFSKTGDVYEGTLPEAISSHIQRVISSEQFKSLGTVSDTKRHIGSKDAGTLIRIVVPGQTRQVLAYMQVSGEPKIPTAVDELLNALKDVDREKGKRLKDIQPQVCAPLVYRTVFSGH